MERSCLTTEKYQKEKNIGRGDKGYGSYRGKRNKDVYQKQRGKSRKKSNNLRGKKRNKEGTLPKAREVALGG